jgi:hypothetical protein
MTVNSKPARFNFRILAAVLTLFGTVACSTQTSSTANAEPSVEKAIAPAEVTEPTTFSCRQQGSGWATFVKKGMRDASIPLITWNTKEFGPEFTPENRCKIVSNKLTEVVAKNGGYLGKLQLTTGQVNGLTIVCVITPDQKNCNSDNQLFTLSKESAESPPETLVKITNFSKDKSNSESIKESGQFPSIISLETLVNR